MNAGTKKDLIAALEGIAAEIEHAPAEIEARARERCTGRPFEEQAIMAQTLGGLESRCSTTAIQIRALVAVYLKGKR